jgi:hypothetical protein
MFIDSYHREWLNQLDHHAGMLEAGRHLYLLIDGVFLPDFYRELGPSAALLFEALPGCSDAARSVSPILLPYDQQPGQFHRSLEKCSTWPMLSAIETVETLEQLTLRLASWCVIYADGQRFNFRFPDTRRLPGIFRALTSEQQAQLAGPALRWCYVDRCGLWAELDLKGEGLPPVNDWPILEPLQFGQMVGDSEADEILLRLSDRGLQWPWRPSQCHAIVADALMLADAAALEAGLRIDWCEACLIDGDRPSEVGVRRWKEMESG